MEINEVYASQQNNQSNGSDRGLDQTTYNNHELQLWNNNNVMKGNVIQPKKQQLEDRVLFRYVPKHVVNGCEPTLEQTIRVLDIEYGKEMTFPARLTSGFGRLTPTAPKLFDLQTSIPDSLTSSLSECSPLTDEPRVIALTSALSDASDEAAGGGVKSQFESTIENAPAPETSQVSESVVSASGLSGEENSSELQGEVSAACKETTLSYELEEEVPVVSKKSTLSYEDKPEETLDQVSTTVKLVLPCTRSFCEADKEFEFLSALPVKRSSSLKSSASSGSLTKKKEVRFADVLGLDLESVQLVTSSSDPPDVPRKALWDLDLGERWDESRRSLKQVLQLCPCFSPFGGAPDFSKKVLDRKVMLETFTVDDTNLTVSGSICVVNIAYVKRIFVRYTTNGWLTYDDVAAEGYLGVSSGGRIDKFLFKIRLPSSFGFGNRMEFAIRFESAGQVFWDNNFKANYRVECYLKQLP